MYRYGKRIAARLLDHSGISYLHSLQHSRNRPSAVFIWIPKTAGTSIWTVLDARKLKSLRSVKYRFANKGIVAFGHMDYSELVANGHVSAKFDREAFKFTFVRNPYDRAVSLFSFLKTLNRIAADEDFLRFCRRIAEGECPPIGLYNSRGLSQCNPQVRWIENISMDYVGKYELLKESLEVVASRLGLAVDKIPHTNRSPRTTYRGYYCCESKQIVEHYYSEDFAHFGYSHEEVA